MEDTPEGARTCMHQLPGDVALHGSLHAVARQSPAPVGKAGLGQSLKTLF